MSQSQLARAMTGAVLAWFVVACAGSSPPDPASEAVPAQQIGHWQSLPPTPLSPRTQAHAFWTGDRVLLIGGSDVQPCPPNSDCTLPDEPPLADGAAFEPSSGEWAEIAPAPLPLGQISGTVMLDSLYVWISGTERAPDVRSAFLVYHVRDDRWEELEAPPVPRGTSLGLVAAEDQVIAYHRSQERGRPPDMSYDLATGTWRELPRDPLIPAFDRTIVWAGHEFLLLGLPVVSNPNPGGPSLYRAAGLDPDDLEWRRLPNSEVLSYNPVWFWANGQLINPTIGSADGGEVNNWGRAYAFGGVLDPSTETWSALPDPVSVVGETYQGLSVGGDEYVVSSEGFVLDVIGGTWIPLRRPAGAAQQGEAAVWAGDRLLVWGGIRWGGAAGPLSSDGWAWQP